MVKPTLRMAMSVVAVVHCEGPNCTVAEDRDARILVIGESGSCAAWPGKTMCPRTVWVGECVEFAAETSSP